MLSLMATATTTSRDIEESLLPIDASSGNILGQDVASGSHGQGAEESNSQLLVRDMCKSGWLKWMPPHAERRRHGQLNKSQRYEKYWVVFCIHDNQDAMLEFYGSVHHAFTHQPLESHSLNNCLHVSPCIQPVANDYEFAITLDSHVIRLVASTREEMWEWTDIMKNKLREMKILEPKENPYSKEPALPPRNTSSRSPPSTDSVPFSFGSLTSSPAHISGSRERLVGRNPASPLPPVPRAVEDVFTDPTAEGRRSALSSVSSSGGMASPAAQSMNGSVRSDHHHSSPSVFDFDLSAISLRERSSGQTPTGRRSCLSEGGGSGISSPFLPPPRTLSNSGGALHTVDNSIYEPLCATNSPGFGISSPYASGSSANLECSMASVDLLAPQSSENGVEDANASGQATSSSDRNIPLVGDALPLEEGPPAYSEVAFPDAAPQQEGPPGDTDHAAEEVARQQQQLSLKEAQVARLQREIRHAGGVRLLLRKTDCTHAIALVECFTYVWIAGWKQKDHPYLYNTLHVGDCVLTIAGRPVRTVQEAMKVIKHHPIPLQVEFVIRRVPHGRVFALKREFEGQDIGLIREGNSAEIREVVPDGLAARHGLPLKATSVDGLSLCNWVLTEINNRPLNLFFKDNEVRDRLNAVGKDISILVQPSDLVKALKKQLKSMSNYKKYIVQ